MKPETAIDPVREVEDRLERVRHLQKALKEAEKVLKGLARPQALNDTRKLKATLSRLRSSKAPAVDLPAEMGGLADALEAWMREQERSRPLRFGRQLKEAAEAAGVAFAPLTSDPPEYRLDPFTVAADYGKGTAEVRYARLPLAQVDLDPAALLEARRRMLEALEGRDWQPEAWFDRLLEAYRRRLASEGKPMGERVNLVDLLPEVAFLSQPERFRQDPSRDHFQPYGRVRLAWDLARLRRRGALRRHGLRLSLGSATLGTTRKKDDVLYLEDEGGRGQYYVSLWFVPES